MTQTYTIELTGDELHALGADLNLQRMDDKRQGYDASARATRKLAENIMQQAVNQGHEDGKLTFGGNEITQESEKTTNV